MARLGVPSEPCLALNSNNLPEKVTAFNCCVMKKYTSSEEIIQHNKNNTMGSENDATRQYRLQASSIVALSHTIPGSYSLGSVEEATDPGFARSCCLLDRKGSISLKLHFSCAEIV